MSNLTNSSWDNNLKILAVDTELSKKEKEYFFLRYCENHRVRFQSGKTIETVICALLPFNVPYERYERTMSKVYAKMAQHLGRSFGPRPSEELYVALESHFQQTRQLNTDINLSSKLLSIFPDLNMRKILGEYQDNLRLNSASAIAFGIPCSQDKKRILQKLILTRLIRSRSFFEIPEIITIHVKSIWDEMSDQQLFWELAHELKMPDGIDVNFMRNDLISKAQTRPIVLNFLEAHLFGDNINVVLEHLWLPITQALGEQKANDFPNKKIMMFLSYKSAGDDYLKMSIKTIKSEAIKSSLQSKICILSQMTPVTTKDFDLWIKEFAFKLRCQCQIHNSGFSRNKVIGWEEQAHLQTYISDNVFESYQEVFDAFGNEDQFLDISSSIRLDGAMVA